MLPKTNDISCFIHKRTYLCIKKYHLRYGFNKVKGSYHFVIIKIILIIIMMMVMVMVMVMVMTYDRWWRWRRYDDDDDDDDDDDNNSIYLSSA